MTRLENYARLCDKRERVEERLIDVAEKIAKYKSYYKVCKEDIDFSMINCCIEDLKKEQNNLKAKYVTISAEMAIFEADELCRE